MVQRCLGSSPALGRIGGSPFSDWTLFEFVRCEFLARRVMSGLPHGAAFKSVLTLDLWLHVCRFGQTAAIVQR